MCTARQQTQVNMSQKRIAVISPVAWRTPPRHYGAWETVAGNIAEGLTARGWDVTLFATGDSITSGKLHAVIDRGYEEDKTADPKVCEVLHISEVMEHADDFDLIHNNYDFVPLTYSRLIDTPMLTTIHGFSSPKILPVFRKYKNTYYVSISDADRDPQLPYVATVYNGIDLSNLTFRPEPGDELVFLGRIHEDKGTHLAIEIARLCGMDLVIAGIVQDEEYFDRMVKPWINGSSVRFIGPVNPAQRDELFRRARAVLHPNTIAERFGLVMVEAMGAGVPVIAMDIGSCREIIAGGKTGYLVNNVEEAAKAVRMIDKIDREACRRHVENNFTVDRMVSGYEMVYKEIFRREEAKRTGTVK